MSCSVREYREVGWCVGDVSSTTQALRAVSPALESAANAAKICSIRISWPPGRLLEEPDAVRAGRHCRITELSLKLRNRHRRSRSWSGLRRGRAHSGIVVGWPTTDLTDADANSIAPHAMQIQTDEYVTQIARHQIVQAQDNHVYPAEVRNLTDVFYFQRVMKMSAIFRISSQRVRAFACQQIEIHAEQSDACAVIVGAEVSFGVQRKGLSSH